ncbi:hypothetical protein [Motilibacter rhizosphaerae]|uniref:hypothetical protein n=1 Tax=Motilibacter rhizosphaerae TaxID=598652 RepID=UPI0013EE7A9A|nr:hypothetical protein [Motilibacter rhizosphaerae]
MAVARVASSRRAVHDRTHQIALTTSVGLLLLAVAAARGRHGDSQTQTDALYWLALLVIFVPAAARTLWRPTPTRERLAVAVMLPLALYATRVLLYPTRFVFHDELAHANTLRAIDLTHHLFAANPLLPASASYPGLEIATSGTRSLLGLGDRPAAVVVLVLARVAMTLALLGVVRAITSSSRTACVAALVYTCNPQYLFFNSQYSYQSLSLPLALLTIYLAVTRLAPASLDLPRGTAEPAGVRGRPALRLLALPVLALAAVVVTHHLTAMLLVGTIGLWALLELALRGRGSPRLVPLALLTVLGAVLVAGWVVRPGNTVVSYLSTIAESSASDVGGLAKSGQSRTYFADGGGVKTPQWEQLALVLSLGIVLLSLVPALLHGRRWLRARDAVAVLLCAAGALYPLIPAGHVTAATSEVTDRASGFLFVGLGLLVGGWMASRWSFTRWPSVLLGLVVVSEVFLGQSILGAGPIWSRTPGPYLVSADSRSIDGANVSAAEWEAAQLPPGQRVLADRVGRLLAGAIGGQYSVTHLADHIDASQVLLGATYTPRDRQLIRLARLDYVVDDRRDCTDLPRIGVYYESGELDGRGRTTPVACSALTKFSAVPGAQRVYDNGAIAIYDVRGLR